MISNPFELLQLPRIQQTSKGSKSDDLCKSIPVVVDQESVFVGVPSSSINKLGIRPPQVLSAHSIPPGTVVTAILSVDDELLAYATAERGKYFIKKVDPDNENNTRALKTKEVKHEIKKLFYVDSCVIAIDTQSQIFGFDLNLDENFAVKKKEELIFVTSLTESGTERSADLSSKLSLICVSQSKKRRVVRTYGIDSNNARELLSHEIDPHNDSTFTYYDETLYEADSSKIYQYSLPSCDILKSFAYASGKRDGALDGLVALPNNNVIICKANQIDLIDCTYESLISSLDLSSSGASHLLSYSEASGTIILLSGTDKLLGVTVEPSHGTLLESIGKNSARITKRKPLVDIFDQFKNVNDTKAEGNNALEKTQNELSEIIECMQKYTKERNGPEFAKIVTYLKDSTVKFTDIPVPEDLSELVYDEKDRNCDSGLIHEICRLAFLPRFKPFLPMNVAIYLLTHPLFPTNEPDFKHFLRSLEKSDTLLYRQAIASLPGILAEDLVVALTSLDEQTFLYAALRLQEDYGKMMIIQALKVTFSTLPSLSSLTVLVSRLVEYPEAVGLLRPVVDAVGLLGWDIDEVRAIKEKIFPLADDAENCAKINISIAALLASAGYTGEEDDSTRKKTRYSKPVKQQSQATRHIPNYSLETLVMP